MLEEIGKIGDQIRSEDYGNKAKWLSWLHAQGYNVPTAFFLPAKNKSSFYNFLKDLQNELGFKNLLGKFRLRGSDLYSIAIRSSATDEDEQSSSKAGHYESYLGNFSFHEILDKIIKIVENGSLLQNNFARIGIIVQKKIDAKISGVIFSSNIFNHSKDECIINYTKGMGAELLAGRESGKDLIVRIENDIPIKPYPNLEIDNENFTKLIRITKEIETKLKHPVDIEWCIDNNKKLFILQCRPITGLNIKQKGVFEICIENIKYIPEIVLSSDKIKLRILALENKIRISKAYLVIIPCEDEPTMIDLNQIRPENQTTGFSIVSLYPKTINGKIVRFFAEKEFSKNNIFYRTCQRYKIRTYEENSSLEAKILNIANLVSLHSWISVSIILEIFNPIFTGIIKKVNEGYIIEVGKGHFIPKGLVPVSQYLISKTNKVLFKNEVTQPFKLSIADGDVIQEKYNKVVKLDNESLNNILSHFKPIINSPKIAIEFGIIMEKNKYQPFLIDLVEDKSVSPISKTSLKEGIISMGAVSGKAINIHDVDNRGVDFHFHDNYRVAKKKGKYIFICECPDISLLNLINAHSKKNIGFIFRNGSVLSHLSIILREMKIPALINSTLEINDSSLIKMDAHLRTKPDSRVENIQGIVLPYVNPDTDGVCTALAYSFLYPSFEPVVFGVFDKETNFVLKHFNINFPKQVKKISNYALIALVDTHHLSQLPEKINFENVIEIIDHHTAGDPDKFENAVIQNELVGSACTLIAERMKEQEIKPHKALAGIMGLAIVSNTLNFSAPSTSIRDKDAYKWLSSFCTFSKELILGMFKARSDFSHTSLSELVDQNTKLFNFNNVHVGICQIEMTGVLDIIEKPEFINALHKYKKLKKIDYFLFTGVDIFLKKTVVTVVDQNSKKLVEYLLNEDFYNNIMIIPKILLRKTDFVPKMKLYFTTQ